MKPIVCWDFDETLGYFRPLEFRYLGEEAPAGMPQPRLKLDVRELIASLPEFTHVVTTAAIADYAKEVLREHGLHDLFAWILGREDGMLSGEGKDYKVVGDRFGLDEADQPPEPLAAALRRLVREGEGEAKRGFDRLLELARAGNPRDPFLCLEEGGDFQAGLLGKLCAREAVSYEAMRKGSCILC